MATEDISIRVKIDDVKAKLAELPNLSKKEFSALISAAETQLKKMPKIVEKEAKEAAKAIEKANKEIADAQQRQMDDIKKGATVAFGGVINDAEDAAKALAALGPVGATVAVAVALVAAAFVAVPIAAVAAAVAVNTMVEAADAAIQRIEDLGGSTIIGQDQIDAVNGANDAIKDLKFVVDELVVVFVSDMAPGIEKIVYEIAAFVKENVLLIDELGKTHSLFEELVISGAELFWVFSNLKRAIRIIAVEELDKKIGTSFAKATTTAEQFRLEMELFGKTVTGFDGLDDAPAGLSPRAQQLKDEMGARKAAAELAAKLHEEEEKRQQRHLSALQKAKEARKEAAAAEALAAKEIAAAEALAAKAQESTIASLSAIFDGYAKKVEERNFEALDERGKIVATYNRELEAIEKLVAKAEDQRKAAVELNDAEFDRAETQDQVAAATERAAKIQDEYNRAVRIGQITNSAATDEYIAKTREMEARTVALAEKQKEAIETVIMTTRENWRLYFEEVGKHLSAQLGEFEATFGQIANKIGDIGAAYEALQRQRLEGIMEERGALIEAIANQSGAERSASVEKLKATRAEANEARKQVAKGFRIQQAAAISSAIIDAARSALALIPAFAFAGPGAPFLAAGVAGSALAIQLATIKGQQPKFHAGLDPSETPAILTRGEGVANARAMAQPGFGATLQAANAGMTANNQGPMVLILNDRVLSTLDTRTRRIAGRDGKHGNVVRLGSSTHYMGG